MGERLRAIGRFLGRVVSTVWGWILAAFQALGRGISRTSRVSGLRREIRQREHERRETLLTLGKLVFVLHKRGLVRNPDLLAECQKIVELDAAIDGLQDQVDDVRTERDPGSPAPPVAATPAEFDPQPDPPQPAGASQAHPTEATVSA